MSQKRCVVLGATGFLGFHLVRKLKDEGCHVVAIDRKGHNRDADLFHWSDLRQPSHLPTMMRDADEVYQLAADMGGAEFVFSGDNDADILRNNVMINAHVLEAARMAQVGRIFFSSSACVYPDQDTSELGFTPTELGLYTKHSGLRESEATRLSPIRTMGSRNCLASACTRPTRATTP